LDQGTVLLVDDDPLVLEALREIFDDIYRTECASSGEEALRIVSENKDIDAIVLDIRMADIDGLQVAARIKEMGIETPIIFHTGYPGEYSEAQLDDSYRPFDYVGKNERPLRLERAVKNAVAYHRLETHCNDLTDKALRDFGMVGRSQKMRDVYRSIAKIAPTNSKVMILGPTGSGKEKVARAIHSQSARSQARMVIINCNHKTPDLIESELFGHLRGSFTGAVADRVGMFEYADGGTLFLDEVGDLDITTQGKLLRVLETGEMQRIGSPETIRVDVRLLCATHHDLPAMVAKGRFREDLYYRLKGVVITLPSLAERRDDIPDLIDHFISLYCRRSDQSAKLFQPEARQLLIEYDWPGNVRQLMDTVQSLIDLTPSCFITRKDVESYLKHKGSETLPDGSFRSRVREYKRTLVIQALDNNRRNFNAAARELSLDPSNLRKLAKDLELN